MCMPYFATRVVVMRRRGWAPLTERISSVSVHHLRWVKRERLSGLLLSIDRLGHFRPIDQLHECHRRIVARTKTKLQNTAIAARTRGITRADFRKEFE